MKKIFALTLSVLFFAAILSSCTAPGHCAAYSKIQKIESDKLLVDKTQKSI